MTRDLKRIAISTGGGDAPGLNAVIRAAVLSAVGRGWEVVGIRKGYEGLLDTSKVVPLGRRDVRGITHLGGTIIGTTNHGHPFEYPVKDSDGQIRTVDRSDEVLLNFRRLGLDALITIGGDGSMKIAQRFAEKGMPVIGVPKTIDNDLAGTVITFGFDTAVGVATEAIDRLHSTAEAHERVFVVEVMGRYAGWIALHAGIAATADAILIPEIPYDLDAVCRKIYEREAQGRHFAIVVAAEGAHPKEGSMVTRGKKEVGREVRLGGIGEQLATDIAECTGKETRTVVLGHLQRGGSPSPFDRVIAQRFGAAAVQMIAQERFSVMVALDPPKVLAVPLSEATKKSKLVPLDGDTVLAAREMGVCLGD